MKKYSRQQQQQQQNLSQNFLYNHNETSNRTFARINGINAMEVSR